MKTISLLRTAPFAAVACLSVPFAAAQDADGVDAAAAPSAGLFDDDAAEGLTPHSDNRRVEERRIVHPITAPNISEDPFITTDIRGTFVYHSFPASVFPGDSEARLYDFQGRYAVNEKLQVFVNKLGVADIHTPSGNDHGVTDIGVGLKYSFLSDWESHRFVALGASYEFGTNGQDNFYEDDEARVFATFAARAGEVNLSGSANLRFPTGSEDANGDSDNLSLHLHADYAFSDTFSPVLELNYYKTLSNGDNVTP